MVSGDKCGQYTLKYVMKGADMAFVKVERDKYGDEGDWNYDEFAQIRLARYLTAMEAYLAMHGEPLVRKSHQVKCFNLFHSISLYIIGR